MLTINSVEILPSYKLLNISTTQGINRIEGCSEALTILKPLQYRYVGDNLELSIPSSITNIKSYIESIITEEDHQYVYTDANDMVVTREPYVWYENWSDGTAIPMPEEGEVGAYFLHLPSCDLYKKTLENQWERIGNMRGAQGIRGFQGVQGVQGSQGAPGQKGDKGEVGSAGSTGKAGTYFFDGGDVPSNSLGLLGDLYLQLDDGSNSGRGDIYRRLTTRWERIGNILGVQGVQGEKGDMQQTNFTTADAEEIVSNIR